jgi:lipid-binding SYLF domain-containing protein
MKMRMTVRIIFVLCTTIIIGLMPFSVSHAATAKEIDVSVDVAIARFTKEVKGAKEFLHAAKGVLIIPRVIQAGLIIGGEYGEGALRIGGKTVGYYNIAAGSFGYQIGAQEKDIILVFMDEAALKKFRSSDNWQAGVDGTVALGKIGAEGSIDTTKIKQPIVGFVFGQKGLMAGASIEGSKFTKLKK